MTGRGAGSGMIDSRLVAGGLDRHLAHARDALGTSKTGVYNIHVFRTSVRSIQSKTGPIQSICTEYCPSSPIQYICTVPPVQSHVQYSLQDSLSESQENMINFVPTDQATSARLCVAS
jgi:hypothetical protein